MRWLLLAVAMVLVVPAQARADEEIWNWLELRLPVPDGGGLAPSSIRFVTDSRIGGRYPGLGFQAFRVGPIWEVNKYLFVALQGTAIAVQRQPKSFVQEYRLEFEPNLRGRFGAFTFNDRNRVEHRWIAGTPNWRYRNQLRVNYAPEGAKWMPFVWDEVIFDLTAGQFQNRAEVGIGWAFMAGARLDVGYMLRTREVPGDGWANDHVLNLSLFYAPPAPGK